jgi:hypothetical protein
MQVAASRKAQCLFHVATHRNTLHHLRLLCGEYMKLRNGQCEKLYIMMSTIIYVLPLLLVVILIKKIMFCATLVKWTGNEKVA